MGAHRAALEMLDQDRAIADIIRRLAWLLFLVSVGVGFYVAWHRAKPGSAVS